MFEKYTFSKLDIYEYKSKDLTFVRMDIINIYCFSAGNSLSNSLYAKLSAQREAGCENRR